MGAGGAMAADAVGGEFLFLQGRGMTGMTVCLRMRSGQLEFRVVVRGDAPLFIAVTIAA